VTPASPERDSDVGIGIGIGIESDEEEAGDVRGLIIRQPVGRRAAARDAGPQQMGEAPIVRELIRELQQTGKP
jgi:hypothetical protein